MKIETDNANKVLSKQELVCGRVYRGVVSKDIYLCVENKHMVNLKTAVVVDYEGISSLPVFEEVEAKVVISG